MITSLFDLDRVVREAGGRRARAKRALAALTSWDDVPPNPLAPFRAAFGKDTFVELASVPDPLLAPALRTYVARLTLDRVLWEHEVRVARAWSEAAVELDDKVKLAPLPGGKVTSPASPMTLLLAVLVDPDAGRRRHVAEAFARAARERLRDPVRLYADRRAAAAAQLGADLDAIDLPAPLSVLEAAAEDLLEGTREIAERFAPWDQGLHRSMARGAASGWPAHLVPRWVLSVFAGTEIAGGAGVRDVPLPPVLGAASYARGLAAFGEAFGEAAGPTGAPFAIVRPAMDLRPLRIGALFGMLAGQEVFARRTLGAGRAAARDHARAFAAAGCAQARLMAAAMRVRRGLYPPSDDLEDRYCEETARAWGEPLPPALAGAVPRIGQRSGMRFAATALAALDLRRMIERFDEDWYQNPRSAEALRALAAEPEGELKEEVLKAGAAELVRVVKSGSG